MPERMLTMRVLSAVAASVLLVACGDGSDTDESANLWQVSVAGASTAPLTRVSGQPLASYLKNGLYAQADVPLAGNGSPPPAELVSTTNLITQGVDEADRVKFAAQTLYVSGVQHQDARPYVKRWQRNEDSSLSALQDVELSPELQHIDGIYVSDDQLTVVGSDINGYAYQPFSSYGWDAASSQIIVQVFEQGNNVYRMQFDGQLIASRRTAEAVWLVSRYTPAVEGFRPHAATVADKLNNMQVLTNTDLTELMPKRQLNEAATEPLIASQQCYLPADMQTNEGSSRMVVVTRIATSAPYQTQSSCIVASIADIYMSTEHLYLHGSVSGEESVRTVLHKFSLDEASVGYQATGAVEGYIGGSQSAFMLYEKQQHLMLLPSRWSEAGLQHQFLTLQQDGTSLKVVARLPNAQQPDQVIGKPGEDIYGVRFVADRAYVVTFERTDPLYTLDISNPLQPAIVGELEIPGYSAYLHSINENLLWGLGQQIELNAEGFPLWETAGSKVALFDVSANDAVVQQELVFNAQYSPLELQHHSLTTLQHGNVTRLALPLSRYSSELGEQLSLLTLEVDSNGAMDITGELIATQSSLYGLSWGARSVLVEDDIYFIVDDRVYHSNWQLPEQVIGQY
ncbi:MAG: hypothetical protein CML20_07020 [Rheinheimera sp.]|nr:hypothetical protein [Rheinheimera sp.]